MFWYLEHQPRPADSWVHSAAQFSPCRKGPRAMSSLINETDNLHEIFETLLSVLKMHLVGALSLLEPVIFFPEHTFFHCIFCAAP